ncbi:MAG: dCTP deaminase [Chloroflexi bacterium]|nr:dCTP deaminase [Chloroflexota bacterium]
MVLSDRTIREEIEKGRIVIDPFDPSCVQPASVDLHLGRKLLVFRTWKYPYYIDLRQPLDGLTTGVAIPKHQPFSLQPGEFVLASTVESITLPNDIVARLEGKSSLGRIGLLIHSTAGYVDPGWQGHLTLEISSAARMPILLYAGMRISQISFLRLTTPADRPYGHPELKSKYQGQKGPTRTLYYEEFGPQAQLLPLAPVAVKAKETKAKDSTLREWIRTSQFRGSVAKLAEALGVPVKTVEDWVYRGANPGEQNRRKVFQMTGLPRFKPRGESPQPELSKQGLLEG